MLKLHIYQRITVPTNYLEAKLPKFVALLADDTLITYPDQTELTFYSKHAVLGSPNSYQLLCHIDEADSHPEYFL